MAGVFYDERTAVAITDRLVTHSCILLFNGRNNKVRDMPRRA